MVKKCLYKVRLEITKQGPKSLSRPQQPGDMFHVEGGSGNVPLFQAFNQFPPARPGERLEGNNGDRMVVILEPTGKMNQRTFGSAGFEFGNDKTYSHGIIAGVTGAVMRSKAVHYECYRRSTEQMLTLQENTSRLLVWVVS